ncbi:hypothetical protein ACQ4PT_053718 [Festuca glaucescens]
MDDLKGDVCCNIEKWCKLMARLTVDQRARLAQTNLRSMMMIPSVKMRTILIRFMLEVFDPATDSMRLGRKGKQIRQWPKGNLGMLQYLYWEKCLPQEGNCAFNPRLSIRPLMRNWNEVAATRRDNFDYENGRGRGNVKIEENITEEYRMQEPVVPDLVPARPEKAKPASALPKKKQAAKPIDNDQMERTLELFNKEGVTYKPADAAVSSNMEDEEDVNSFQNGPREKKEFMYKEESDSEGGGARVCPIVDMTLPDEGEEHGTHVKKPAENGTAQNANESMRTPAKATRVNGRTPDKPFGDLGSTPDNPFIIDNVDPVTSDSEIDIDAVSVSKFLSKARKDAPNGCPPSETGKEDELVGKRKRTVLKKFQSPYALDRRTKCQVCGSSTKALNFDDKPGPDENSKPDASSDLTQELVDAAIVFLELASRSEQHKKKNGYRSSTGDEVNAERLRVVLDHRWLYDGVIDGYLGHLALRLGHDRFLCPAWRSKYLVDRAIAGDKPQESSKNMDSEMVRSNAVRRVLAEYTVREKIYFPLNIGNTHWMTVVMHMPKQEFQVLDSLYPIDLTLETVQALRNSCGLFVIECMEHWDGDRMSAEISQVKIDARRRRVVAEMMLSPSNTLEIVKQKIRTIASKIKKKA